MTGSTIKRYSELAQLRTFDERFNYLRLSGKVGRDTFGFDRVFNQMFYSSREWKRIRSQIIFRDQSCDLGVPGILIPDGSPIYIHHMNPIDISDIHDTSEYLMNPEYLICCSRETHNAIHYQTATATIREPIFRQPNDTCPWKK